MGQGNDSIFFQQQGIGNYFVKFLQSGSFEGFRIVWTIDFSGVTYAFVAKKILGCVTSIHMKYLEPLYEFGVFTPDGECTFKPLCELPYPVNGKNAQFLAYTN